MTPVPDPTSDAGATNTPNLGPSATEGVQAATEALSGSSTWEQVEALAALLEPEAFDDGQPADEAWRHVTRERALSHAAKVITSDYRRVSEDDDTIDEIARAILAVNPSFKCRQAQVLARAAVRALREETA